MGIKRKGSIVIKNVVDDEEAKSWKASLEEFVKENPDVRGEYYHVDLPSVQSQSLIKY